MKIWRLLNRWKEKTFASTMLTRMHFVNRCQYSLKGLGLSPHFKGWQYQSAPFCWMISEKKSFFLVKHCCKQQSLTYCFYNLNTNLHMQIWRWSDFLFLYKMFCTKTCIKDQAGKNLTQCDVLQPPHPLTSICVAERINIKYEFWWATTQSFLQSF